MSTIYPIAHVICLKTYDQSMMKNIKGKIRVPERLLRVGSTQSRVGHINPLSGAPLIKKVPSPSCWTSYDACKYDRSPTDMVTFTLKWTEVIVHRKAFI